MGLDFNEISKMLDNMTDEEWEKYFPKDNTPKGWVSIEEHLPKFLAKDFSNGGSQYKVKYKDGKIGNTIVADHNTWYYYAKDSGITHWLND